MPFYHMDRPAEQQALRLLHRVVTEEEFNHFMDTSYIEIRGEHGDFHLMASAGIHIYQGGKPVATGCLVIVPMGMEQPPLMDYIVANYIVLKRREMFFWRTAIISPMDKDFKMPIRGDQFSGVYGYSYPFFAMSSRIPVNP